MEMKPIASSHIMAIGHDPETDTMIVQYKGGAKYSFAGVSAAEFANLEASESKGKHLRSMGVKGTKV